MTRILLLVLVGMGWLGLGLGMGADPPPSTLTVCPQGLPACDFAQIQPAIEAAPPGATLEVGAGVYQENLLVVDKPLTLRGQGENTTIQGALPGVPVVQIRATRPLRVLLEAVSIVGPDLDPALVQAFGEVDGVVISGSPQAVLRRVRVSRAGAQGVDIQDAAEVMIEDSQFFHNGSGIAADGDSQVTIRRVLAFGNGVGIGIGGSAQVQLEEVWVLANGTGIVVSGPTAGLADPVQVLIQNSDIAGNGFGGPSPGISVYNTAKIQILQTRIYGNHRGGLYVSDGNRNVIDLMLSRSFISFNRFSGVFAHLGNPETRIELIENEIYANERYGVEVDTPPCVFRPTTLRGTITGRKNRIPGLGEGAGNYLGAVCPGELEFLMTEQGGSYP